MSVDIIDESLSKYSFNYIAVAEETRRGSNCKNKTLGWLLLVVN